MERWIIVAACGWAAGCAAHQPPPQLAEVEFRPVRIDAGQGPPAAGRHEPRPLAQAAPTAPTLVQAGFEEPAAAPASEAPAAVAPPDLPAPDPQPYVAPPLPDSDIFVADPGQDPNRINLDQVIDSVYRSYPLLQAALYMRNIALGDTIAAQGEFDLKLKGATENGPTGFYQTYRQSVGVVQPLYGGGEVFAGYRVGRGDFQPWYLERQTNDGGEFKAGVGVPLLQNVDIDPRRAALWQAQYGRYLAEPEIQAQLIDFVRASSYVYWEWVAAGEKYRIAEHVLELAVDRTGRIENQVQAGLIDPPELTDNLRLVAERRAQLAESGRKLDQTAVKLSLYLRDPQGRPWTPERNLLPKFPPPKPWSNGSLEAEIAVALEQRPELKAIDWQRRQLEVEFAQADNQLLPSLDAMVAGSQDVGQPTSKKRDKSQFELEAGLFLDVPVQRRKARGKVTALEGKLAQLSAKRRLLADKVAVDVEAARIGLAAALKQVDEATAAVRLAEELADRERRNLELGLSDVLKVTLREQYAAESALKAVDALLVYYQSLADFRAALGMDRLQ
jgi:outer membrane protein TolC